MERRGFLGSILALGVSPAIVRAESLMRIWVPQPDCLVRAVYCWQQFHGTIYVDEINVNILTIDQIVTRSFHLKRDQIVSAILARNALLSRMAAH